LHPNSQLLFDHYALPHFADGQRVLEIAPDQSPSAYQQSVTAAGVQLTWETADLAEETMGELLDASVTRAFVQAVASQHIMPSEYEIPAAADSFDVVVAGQVAEHVRRIWVWIVELARVTKPGGKIVLINPISWVYHEAPVDCWRIYPEGMRALCHDAGLHVLVCETGALEPAVSRRQYYGDSYHWPTGRRSSARARAATMVRGAVGWPTPTPLDLVTVAQKPA
jgi:SAM-dependent methyltransferase